MKNKHISCIFCKSEEAKGSSKELVSSFTSGRVLELDDLEGPFEPKPLYDSKLILFLYIFQKNDESNTVDVKKA